ncbi:uncharacterized protein [Rutidosis leptorrhynchoides]|uniref:uncharacterized protein n=1 Tax=Rutidosis leptorrhynchoides TaxID=125765 RepID=UPI003A9A0D39
MGSSTGFNIECRGGDTSNGQSNTAVTLVSGILKCNQGAGGLLSLPDVSSPAIVGVPLNVTCNGNQLNLGQTLTDVNGLYNFTIFSLVDILLFDPSNCAVNLNLPIASCSLFPPTGILHAPMNLTGVVSGVLPIFTFLGGPFSVV